MDWLEDQGQSCLLWLPGIPGSGKTYLAAIVSDHLQRKFAQPEVGIISLFCDYKDPSQTIEKFQRAILRQLLQKMEKFPPEINHLYERHLGASSKPDPGEIRSILLSVVSRFSQIYLIVDALDEVPGAEGILGALLKLCDDFGSSSHSLITSRWTGELDHHIRQAPHIEIWAQGEDIRLYLDDEFRKRQRIQRFTQRDPAFQAEAVDTILQHCKGMFLVARLHIESLATRTNLRAAKLALHDLPRTLDELYTNTVDRINRQAPEDVELAWRVIGWVVRSKMPLTVVQLQNALAVDHGCNYLDHDAFVDMDLILAVCVGLVVLNPNSWTIHPVHFTAQDFLERNSTELIPRAECDMAQTCLHYLSFDKTAYFSPTDDDLIHKFENFPLYEYAAKHWGTHAVKCAHSDCDLDGGIEEFCSNPEGVAGAAQGMLVPPQKRYWGFSQDVVRDLHPSHLAAYFGLQRTLETLLETEKPDYRDTAGRTPLHWAARQGHTSTTKLLLDNGAEVDAVDNVRATSLHLACMYGHQQVASLLIENGSDVNAANNVGGTALIWAAIAGSVKVATLLLTHGADVNAWLKGGATALVRAVEREDEKMVDLLVNHGADVNSGRPTPLCVATGKSNPAIMRVLLEAGAVPDIPASSASSASISKTVIGAAIRAKTDGPLRLLLRYGADPNRRGAHGETPMQYAALSGRLEIVNLLLEAGGQLDPVDDSGNTVLHAAVNEENEANDGEEILA